MFPSGWGAALQAKWWLPGYRQRAFGVRHAITRHDNASWALGALGASKKRDLRSMARRSSDAAAPLGASRMGDEEARSRGLYLGLVLFYGLAACF